MRLLNATSRPGAFAATHTNIFRRSKYHHQTRSRLRVITVACFIMFPALIIIALFTRIFMAAAANPLLFDSNHFRGKAKHLHSAKLGAVTSLSDICSKAGIKMLEQGGNAADAMIATELCVGVVGMNECGLGGGGFMLIRASDGSYESVDFRETAPAAAFRDMYKNNEDASLYGGLASGIPGELRGLEYLHNKYARLPWKKLFQPAISVARHGFIINSDLTKAFDQTPGTFLTSDPSWAMDFAPNGTLLGVGDRITRRRYANLLDEISEKGAAAFYSGHIAKSTISALAKANGTMTLDDLKNYSVRLRDPIQITYRDFKITSMGAPSSGAVVLSIMKTLEGYPDIGEVGLLNLSTHRLDESIRFGYGARTKLGDPRLASNITTYVQSMISPATASLIRSKISDSHTLPVSDYNPDGIESLVTHGTSHIVTADKSGLSISLTSTINLWFGSQLMVPETGLILNNEMNDFSVPGVSNAFGYIPSPSNYIVPGNRPQSSMSPLIIEFLRNNTLYYVLGAGGGSHIITATVQCMWNVLDRKMGIVEAVETPRFHDQLVPNQIEFEYSYNNLTTAFLRSRGHEILWSDRQSDTQTLRRLPNGTFEAAAEPGFTHGGGFAI